MNCKLLTEAQDPKSVVSFFCLPLPHFHGSECRMKCSKLDDLSPPQMDDEEHQGSLMDDAHTRTSSHLIWPNAFLMQLVLLKLLISWISSLWISPFTELSQLLDKPLQSTAIYK